MRYILGILVVLALSSCAFGNKLPPAPVYGVDIQQVQKGEVAPFSGTIFSPFYLDQYLQWKASK